MSSANRDQILEELNHVVQLLGNRTVLFTHAIASQIGLSATEFECLDFIQECGPVPAGRLAELTGLTTGAVTGLIDRLEKAGFAKRTPDPTDRRRVLVETIDNETAVKKIRSLYQPVSTAFYDQAEKYSDTELETVIRYITESIRSVEAITNTMTRQRT